MSRISLYGTGDSVINQLNTELDLLEQTRSYSGTGVVKTPLSTESFFTQLSARVSAANTLLCVGLDPHAADIGDGEHGSGTLFYPPGFFLILISIAGGAQGAKAFCMKLIKETSPYAACFKPNAAFFEAFGPDGVTALHEVVPL